MQKYKRFLSLLLSVAMLVTTFAVPNLAYADSNDSALEISENSDALETAPEIEQQDNQEPLEVLESDESSEENVEEKAQELSELESSNENALEEDSSDNSENPTEAVSETEKASVNEEVSENEESSEAADTEESTVENSELGVDSDEAGSNDESNILDGAINALQTLSEVLPITAAPSGSGPIKVWDFGGVLQEGDLYTNYITKDFWNEYEKLYTAEEVEEAKKVDPGSKAAKGTFKEAVLMEITNGLSFIPNANDRMYYGDGEDIRSAGTYGNAKKEFDDGYTSDGCWYLNGTGGSTKRYLTIDNVAEGSEIKVYAASSNSINLVTHIDYAGEGGTQEYKSEEMALGIINIIAEHTGQYKIWFDTDPAAKPMVYRVVVIPPLTVNISVNTGSFAAQLAGGYEIKLRNDSTGAEISKPTESDKVSLPLTPGYSYTASLSGVQGVGFTNATRKFNLELNDLLSASKDLTFDVEAKSTYTATGKIEGFAEGYDTSKLKVIFNPEEGSGSDPSEAKLEGMNYTVTLDPDVKYTVSISGANDYEITEGGTISGTEDPNQTIKVALKAMYKASGNIVGGASVTKLQFKNVEDGYIYDGTVEGSSYTVDLRTGAYEVSAEAEGFVTHGHVVVEDKDTQKDILFVPKEETPPTVDTSVRDIYVGVEGKTNNFATMTEALKAAAVMNPTSEDQRVTINIAPGVYREQLKVATPYLTFKPYGKGEVKLTWYYGIGYEYYSADEKGFYNYEKAFDKYDKHIAEKWGVGTYIQSTAVGFKAEDIVFEASFNKYITDEEIADGAVKSEGAENGNLPQVRNYSVDPESKAATERSTAIAVEGDKAEFKNCIFNSSQDTLYMGDNTHTYYKNCQIEGCTDYIFGSGNALFDGCELRFCGYSDTAMGGYITAARLGGIADCKGYLFRACTVTNKEGNKHTAGYFGRPWGADATVTFLNTILENADAIEPSGWYEMSGNKPENANFKEFGTTTVDGTAVDTSRRVAGTVLSEAPSYDAKAEYLGWDATYYTEGSDTVSFSQEPYFITGGDVLRPVTGDTFIVGYSLGDNDANDASVIVYSLIDAEGTETVVKTTTAIADTGVKLVPLMKGSKLKVTVTPKTIFGAVGEPASVITENAIEIGSGSVDTERPSGKAVVFLAGDSTVMDYSAGAINNSGKQRNEGSWGEFLKYFINDNNYEVMDYGRGGRSSRTFMDGTASNNYSDADLQKIVDQMMAGDYLFIQFGHNDCYIEDAERYVPLGEADANGIYPYTAPSAPRAADGTYKYYLKQYVDAAKAVGATPVLVTPVTRKYINSDGTIRPHHGTNNDDNYVTAMQQVAQENDVLIIDFYSHTKEMIEGAYKIDGQNGSSVLADRAYVHGDKTHQSKLGGFAFAADLAEIIQGMNTPLAKAIKAPDKPLLITDSSDYPEFIVDTSGYFTGYGENAEGQYDDSVACEYWTKYINDTIKRIADNMNSGSDEPATESTSESTTESTSESTTESTSEASTDNTDESTTESTSETSSESASESSSESSSSSSSGSSSGGGSSSSSGGSSSRKASSSSSASSGSENNAGSTNTGNTENTGSESSSDNNSSSSPDKGAEVASTGDFVTKNGFTINPPALKNSSGQVVAGSSLNNSSLVPSANFNDTSNRSWANNAINKLASMGVINGVGEGKFAPDEKSKRGDFMVMLTKVLGITGTPKSSFSDVPSGSYYANAVNIAKDLGLASGTGDNKFNPEAPITRQDMMVLAARALDAVGYDVSSADVSVLNSYVDAGSIADYAKPYVAFLIQNGLVNGTSDTTVTPTADMTRAQMAVLMSNLYDAVTDKVTQQAA